MLNEIGNLLWENCKQICMDKCNNSYFHISFYCVQHVACCSSMLEHLCETFLLPRVVSFFFVNSGTECSEKKIFSFRSPYPCLCWCECVAVSVRISPQSQEEKIIYVCARTCINFHGPCFYFLYSSLFFYSVR